MNEDALSQLYLKDTAFQDLMQKRIFNVLLVASPYDAFMMEEDGRIEEQLYFEYVALNLSSPPRVTKVSTTEQAMEAMEEKHFGLTIMMPGSDISETFAGARKLKELRPTMPVVVLTPSPRKSPGDLPTKISQGLTMCSAGLATLTFFWQSSSFWRTAATPTRT